MTGNPDQPSRAMDVDPTPGPWRLRAGHPTDVESHEFGQVAACEMEKDARLIAAAPDLLAACKAQHEAIDTLFAMLIVRSPPGDTFHPSKSGALWDACVAGSVAIAKAEGG